MCYVNVIKQLERCNSGKLQVWLPIYSLDSQNVKRSLTNHPIGMQAWGFEPKLRSLQAWGFEPKKSHYSKKNIVSTRIILGCPDWQSHLIYTTSLICIDLFWYHNDDLNSSVLWRGPKIKAWAKTGPNGARGPVWPHLLANILRSTWPGSVNIKDIYGHSQIMPS